MSFRHINKAVFIGCLVFLLCAGSAYAQIVPDSTNTRGIDSTGNVKADTASAAIFDSTRAVSFDTTSSVRIDSTKLRHSAKRATLLSTFLPGAGQCYNKKYWKMPIIYGGFGVMIYVISFNQKYYKTFKSAYQQSVTHDSLPVAAYPEYTYGNLLTLRDYYRRNRDLTYVLAGVLYALNVLDAYVDAELFKFDVSDDLSLHGEPMMLTFPGNVTTAGLRLTLDIK